MLTQTQPSVYRAFDPTAEINGRSMSAVLDALQLIPRQARELLERHGLPSEPQAGGWYPLQAWLDALADLERTYGSQMLYHTGLRVVDNSAAVPRLRTLAEAVQAMNDTYRANVRGVNIGYYQAEEVSPTELRVRCHTPTPAELEAGLLTSLVRKYKPADALRVRIEQEVLPVHEAGAGRNKVFRISW